MFKSIRDVGGLGEDYCEFVGGFDVNVIIVENSLFLFVKGKVCKYLYICMNVFGRG